MLLLLHFGKLTISSKRDFFLSASSEADRERVLWNMRVNCV
jgi:hypothetical protein